MVEVNCDELKNIINSLNAIIDEYEIVELNIFNQLKDLSNNWQDNNSVKFDDSINLDKRETEKFLNFLKSNKDVYDYIYRRYAVLGKIIKCNLNSRDIVLNSIDVSYKFVVDILSEFQRINNSFTYTEQTSIFEQKNKIIKVRNELANIRKSVKNLYNKIEHIELEINNKIKQLGEFKINEFHFSIN